VAESFINLTEGSGKKAHTFQRVIGANTIEDEVMLIGEQYLATYNIPTAAAGISVATANSHLLQIMAGASLVVFVRQIRIYQLAAATAAAIDAIEIVRLTTAGTGGTAITPAPRDSADAASGATAMTLPTVKGTEGTFIERATAQWTQTIATQSGGKQAVLVSEFDWDDLRQKSVKIPAGTANGIAIKNPTARAAGTVIIQAVITEANFS
jgi:hypothetical protein